MLSEAFLKRVLMFIGVILSGLITLIFISTPDSLQVPVPDSVPSITTKSTLNREFDEAKQFFETSIQQSINGATLAAVISWSPNNKYILTNLRLTDQNGGRTKPYIMDLFQKKYVEVPNATWIDQASWAGSKLAYQTADGYAYFNIETGESKTFGKKVGTAPPVFSSDGSYIAYVEDGIVVYSLKANQSIKLTNGVTDMPALWRSDAKSLFIFSNPESSSQKATLSLLKIGTREKQFIIELPQPAKRAQWIMSDQSALLTLGADDGSYDYGYVVSNHDLTLVAETSEGIAFTSNRDKQVATLKGNKISVYNSTIIKTFEAKRSEKSRVVYFSLLPNNATFLVREKGTKYDSALLNLKTLVETTLEGMTVPYALISPNGRSAITVKDGNSSAQFIDISNR